MTISDLFSGICKGYESYAPCRKPQRQLKNSSNVISVIIRPRENLTSNLISVYIQEKECSSVARAIMLLIEMEI